MRESTSEGERKGEREIKIEIENERKGERESVSERE